MIKIEGADKSFESCQDCVHAYDSTEICILRRCIHAFSELRECYKPKKELKPSAQPEMNLDEWCTDCKEYDHERHCCPRWNRVIRQTLKDAQPEIIHCGECKHRDPEDHKCDCGHDIIWQLPRDDKWYCADAERRTDDLGGISK